MTNVRCAGRTDDQPSHSLYGWGSCGWTGRVTLDPDCICGDDVRLVNAMVAVYRRAACPDCGGIVELITEEAADHGA